MQNKPIRILQYIGSLNSGGSQSMIMNIYRNIDRNKIQFDFIVHGDEKGFYEQEVKKLGGKIYRVPRYKGVNHLKYISRWNRFFQKHPEYRIIHCHIRSTASIVLKIAKKYDLITICHSHSTSNGKGITAAIKNIYQKQIPKYSDFLFACSREAAIWLYGKSNINDRRIQIISNSIKIEDYKYNIQYRNEIRRKYNISDNTFLVGHVGRFEKAKNHKFIIDIIKRTKSSNVMYMLCGDGSMKDEIMHSVELNDLVDNVIFVSSTNDIYKYYSAFDLFILPSLYEGLGIVLIEAQCSGLVCLVSPYIPREAKISNNYINLELRPNLWADYILLTTNNKDRQKLNLFNSAKNFDINKSCKELEKFYLDNFRRFNK